MPLPLVFCARPCRGRGDMIKRHVCVSGIVLVLAIGGAAVSRAESRAVQSSPSDGGELRLRVAAYWRLLAAGDRKGATRFLRPEHRRSFLDNREPPFQDPEVEGDRDRGGWYPGHRPDRLRPAYTDRSFPMGDPAGLDLRCRGMDGRGGDGARATPSGRTPRLRNRLRPPMKGAVTEAGPSKRRLRE